MPDRTDAAAEIGGAAWEDYFAEGERLLWEGRPSSKFRPSFSEIGLSFFGIPFLLAGAGVTLASLYGFFTSDEVDQTLGMVFLFFFGLPFLGAGIGMVFGPTYLRLNASEKVRYAISTRRAYIATQYWGRRMESYPILSDGPVEIIGNHSVRFPTGVADDADTDSSNTFKSFDNIEDAHKVYRLLRSVQAGEITETEGG